MATSRMTEQIGRVLGGRYRLLSPLGSGASAQVYLADDVRLRRRVAVKILHPALADDESFLRRFRAEAQSAASLSHPHVLAVFDWSGDDHTPFLVTEYLSGGSLRSMLDAGHRLTPAQALVVGLESARALDYAHRQGFVHRDVKPANLLFGGDARLRVADFGLARAIAEAGWTEPSGAVLGTARYASPEQARGESVDGRSDVYSLALVMVEAVTGRVPFAADTTIGTLMARLDRPLEVPGELGPLVPILVRAGAVDPGERLDAAELGAGLVDAATGLTRPQLLPLVGAGQPDRLEGHHDSTMLARSPSGPPDRARGNGSDTTHVMRAGAEATSVMVAAPPAAPPRRPGDTVAVPPVGGPAGPRPPLAEPPAEGLSPNDRGARRLMLGALVVTIAVVVGMAAGWSYMRTQVPSYTVPPLVGLDRSDLASQIAGFDWVVEIDEVRQDDTDPGEILSTDPAAGEKLREGGTLAVVVSAGATLVPVPTDLVGLTEQEARDELEAAGLVAGVTRDQSDEFDEGVVMAIHGDELPAELPKGSTVTLVVSTGAAALQMPDLVGMQFDEAATVLTEMDVEVETQGERVRRREVGRVISTDPAVGEEVRSGDTVVVVVGVSGSDSVSVPDVVGRDYDAAKDAIKDADLEVGDVYGPKDGVVLATYPLPGSEVDEDSDVTLFMRPG